MGDEEILRQFRATRCPEGSRPEIDLDSDEVGCFTPAGERVAPLAQPAATGIGVLGWSAIAAGAMTAVALWLGRGR